VFDFAWEWEMKNVSWELLALAKYNVMGPVWTFQPTSYVRQSKQKIS
jgi:hypothetical protein